MKIIKVQIRTCPFCRAEYVPRVARAVRCPRCHKRLT